MKIIKEKRKLNFFVSLSLAVIFTFAVIVVMKYYQLQGSYYKLMQKYQALSETVKVKRGK